MMFLIPLLAEKARGAENPIHLLLVLPRPEGELHAKGHVRFRLRRVLAFPLSGHELREGFTVPGIGGLLDDLLIGKLLTGFLSGFLLRFLLLFEEVVMHPAERIW